MRANKSKRSVAHAACLILLVLGPGLQAAYAANPSGPNLAANPIGYLTGANSGTPRAIALKYLRDNKAILGLSSSDIAGVVVTDEYTSVHNGVTHLYLRQRYHGLEVHGANININIAADGSVINLGNSFVPDIATAINATTAGLNRGQAISAAARSLGLDESKGAISRKPIPSKLVYQPVAKNFVRLAWDLEIYEMDAQNWWSMRIDAVTGALLDQANYVVHDNFNVYEAPVESPNHGSRTNAVDPEDGTASISGWVDSQCTKGNNVDAYVDDNASNLPTGGDAARACDSGLNFSFPVNLNQEPSQYQDAAVTNLFYWNNLIHDMFYQYGFDESAGNFQENNFGNGGSGSDSVNAEAQDGGGANNANFSTPSDGSNPRMQMFLWNYTSPARDGDFDNGIIAHEYGHGISNRLTGGPGTASCLNNSEQAGEGWSDYFGVWMTIESGDVGTDKRGVGTYALGQPTNGNGIRAYPYSTNMAIDPRTYDAIKSASYPHGIGSTWAAMLWEMTWSLIDRYGFDPDMHNGTGGNNTALQLVVDGLKLQPCSPGFVDARDAILLADLNNNAGANQCLLWDAFAKRGLGYSADQGSAGSSGDGTEAFDIPPVCQETLKITKTATPEPVEAGQVLTYSLLVENDTTGSLSNVTVTDNVPANTNYVLSSATCGGSESGGEVTFPLGSMTSGNSSSCSFQVSVSPLMATTAFSDDMESGPVLWAPTSPLGPVEWALGAANTHSPSSAWFAQDIGSQSDQFLTLVNPIAVNGNAVLSFWHDYDTEFNWDGGVVEISVNGGGWTDLGTAMIQNGYNTTILENGQSSISERPAFSGDSNGYIETRIDLSDYAGNTVQIRFWLGTDGSFAGVGWYIDDVEILDNALLYNEACVTSTEGDNACDSAYTSVTTAPVSPEPNISVSPDSLSATLNKSTNTSTAKTITITNLGGASLSWSVITDSAGDCSIKDNPLWAIALPASDTAAPSASDIVTITFDSNTLGSGAHSAAACVISNDPDQPLVIIPLTLTVEEVASTVDRLATGEIAGTGSVSGNYTDTHVDDGNSQLLVEQHQGGPRPKRHDRLIHTWVFDLTHGVDVVFTGNLSKSGLSGDNESFRLYWSRNNSEFTLFDTVSSVAGSNLVSTPLNLPTTGPGPIYIRIEDSEQIQGHNQNERVAVDYLALTEDTSGGPPPPPPLPPPPEDPVTMIVSDLADVSGTSSRRNRYTAIARATVVDRGIPTDALDGALVSGTFSGGVSGGGSCTTNSSGQCTISKNNVKQDVSPVTFTINNVTRGDDGYDAASSDTSVQLAAP